jgi:hypothetical protein
MDTNSGKEMLLAFSSMKENIAHDDHVMGSRPSASGQQAGVPEENGG